MRKGMSVLGIVVGAALVIAPALRAATLEEAGRNLEVRTALLEKFGTDALGIKIDVSGSRVTLSGAVDKPETRDGAKAVAAAVKGVAAVDDRITVGHGPATRTHEATRKAKENLDDSLLEAHVMARLLGQVGENAFRIGVHARGGVVTLRGEVPTGAIHSTAIETAKGTKGVARLVDEIRLRKT